MKKYYFLITLLGLLFSIAASSQTIKILFDASKAETAGNADWVIDANSFNLGFGSGPAILNGGNEANPSQIPSPAQSGITGSTAETFWKGGISYWGIDCVNRNYIVETLPYNGQITYGNGGNAQDLSNYDVFIVCEPNILFTASEKTAILTFVQNGGGLFMVADHNSSDRNNDGFDSPHIWNDLMTNNSVQNNPFGISFNYVDFSQTTSNIPSLPTDSTLHGPFGDVTQAKWSAGTSMTINTSQNSSVKGVVYKTGSSFGSTNVMFAHARFGNGKVAAIGDSSPCDDGSGDTNDDLFDGYIADAGGNHRKLLMNATIWLATSNSSAPPTADFTASPLSVCIGQTTTFTDASSPGITSYSWNFGAGATPATANTVGPHSVSYSTSGTKTVSLTVTSAGGSNTKTRTNYITVPASCTSSDLGVLSLLNPAATTCPDDNKMLQVRIKNYGGTVVNFSTNSMDVVIQISNPSSIIQSFTKTINSGSLAAGATLDVTFDNTYDMSSAGTYVFNANTIISTDANSANNAMPPVNVTVSGGFETDYTVVSESIGTVGTTTAISTHEANNGFDNGDLTMSGTADVRTTQTSAGNYPGATGGANIFFNAIVGKNFIIEGINTSAYSNLQLSLGFYKSTNGTSVNDFSIQVSSDGINYTPLTIPALTSGASWNYITLSGPIPLTNNLRIQFLQNSATTQYRIDDLLLINSVTTPVITPSGPVSFCQGSSVVLNASVAVSYLWSTGATTQNITVTSTGSYSVTVTNALGCTGVSPSVDVDVSLAFNSSQNVTICEGSTFTLPDGTPVSAAGNYTSTLHSVSGCDSVIVTGLSVVLTGDNNLCTIDACNTTDGSVTHTTINVDDSNVCTTDACNTSTGIITHIPVNADDNNPCTNDNCDSTTGAITHSPVNIDDNNLCTTDACDSSTGSITHIPVNADDNNLCTTDGCDSSTGNISHTPVNTDDGNACTSDGCDSVTGVFHTQVCNTYHADIRNISFVDCRNLEFEVWIEWTAPNAQRFQFFQAGIDFNYAGLSNGGTLTGSFQPGSADASLPAVQQSPNWNINQTSRQIRMLAAIATPSTSAAPIPSSPGFRIGKFRITNTVNFAAGATPDFTWKYAVGTSTTTRTALSCYLNGSTTAVEITVQAFHAVTGNPSFNPDCNNATLNLRAFIEGYYTGGGLMQTLLYNLDPLHSADDCDTVLVELHDANPPFNLVTSSKTILKSNGNATLTFSSGFSNTLYYIVLRHRNCIETWSKTPVLLTSLTNYDFTTQASTAFGDNLKNTPDNMGWSIFSGDINQDGAIDGSDFLQLDPSVQAGDGGYMTGDLNGDGAVDGSDFLVLDPNIQEGIGASLP